MTNQTETATATVEVKRSKAKKPAPASMKAKAAKIAKKQGMGALEAAVAVLKRSKEALGATEIMKRVLAQKLWKTAGKTPAATLNAAIHREIAKRGREARFALKDHKFALR